MTLCWAEMACGKTHAGVESLGNLLAEILMVGIHFKLNRPYLTQIFRGLLAGKPSYHFVWIDGVAEHEVGR